MTTATFPGHYPDVRVHRGGSGVSGTMSTMCSTCWRRISYATTLFVVAWTLLLNVNTVNPETFSSTAALKHLVAKESWVVEQMEEYIAQEEHRLKSLREALDDIRDSTTVASDGDVMGRAGHPIDAFNIIKRWARIGINENTLTRGYSGFRDAVYTEGLTLPVDQDYMGAAFALIRLQRTYQLPTAKLAKGEVQGAASSSTLSPEDMFHLGKAANQVGEMKIAREWFELAVNNSDGTFSRADALWELSMLHRRVGDYGSSTRMGELALQEDPENGTIASGMMNLRTIIKELEAKSLDPYQSERWDSYTIYSKRSYESLCRGEKIFNDTELEAKLVCLYKSGLLPYVRYKEELLSLSPRISMFYEVISDGEAATMQALAYPELYRAMVGDPAKSLSTNERVSQVSWLWDSNIDSLVRKMSLRVQDITSLSTTYRETLSSSEPFQLVNYGIGGQYEPHHDFYEDTAMLEHVPHFIKGTGDRISTFMFYLSEVTAGGATVFPEIGVRVPPVKNSAAFWFNILPNGNLDRRTLHAGCPVLLGQKWVANKWIREWGQELRRPCGQNKYDLDDIRGIVKKCVDC